MDDPAERWANLPAEKRALVEERLRNSGLPGASARRLGPRPSATTTPLSFAQERLWFMDQLEPGSLAYNRPWAVRLKGRLAPDALEAALNRIISRHEPLRTTFTAVDGLPVQAVQTHHDLPLSMVDLSQLPAAEREREAVRRTIEHSRQPFDLARDPMLRPALLRLGTQDHVLLLTTHHIAFDGWSEAVLLHELSVRYAALLRGSDSLLPVLPLQYGDFAYWQRQSLQGEVLERLSSYWKRVLAGAPDVLDLRADHPRPVSQTNRGARLTTRVDGKTLEVLKALGRRTGATLFMSLLTAFQAVLAVRASQMNLLVGCPVAGRNRPELEDLIGFFVDMLVVRADLSGDPTWIDLVARTRRSTLEALAHQDLPFAKLVEILAPRRDLSHLALVQATFQLRNLPKAETRMAEVDLLPFEFDPGLARYDLSLEAEERDGGLTCRLVYNLDLFEEATALRFLSTFERALIAMTADPDQRLSSLRDLLDEREQGRAVPTAPRELEEDFGGPSNLTRNQMRTWLGEQVWPGLPLYNVPFTFSISRSLDALHFQRAFQGLVDRSDALRTVVEVVGGIPQQRVLPGLSFEALCLDFSSRADPEGEARAWAQARCEIPLELDRRLFDCALLRCGPSHSFWYLNFHHLITDLASIHQIFETMQGFYWRSVEGSLDAAPGLPAFAEYIGYERRLRRALLKSTAAPRPQGRSGRPESMRFYGRHPGEWTTRVERSALELGRERTRRLKALALESDYFTKTPDASLLNLIATALFAFLYRVTDRHQLALGVPFHNRREPYAKTLGLLMEFIPFQVMVEEGETFRSLAHKVIQNASELVGRGILAESLASGTKAFEVSLNYLNAVFDRFLEAPAITQYLSHGHDDDTLSVRLEDYEGTGNLRFGFLFNAGTFSPEQQGRAVRHFELMLDAFLSDPGLRLDSVDLVTPEEKELQLRPTFKTGPPPPAYASVVGAFEAQVRKAPEAVALVDGERSLSYGKLNSLANQWARRLRAEGIRPGVTVGVCMGRSVEWLIALLGVLKAGGVYLPLDPSLPRERLRATLEDADAPLVLTQHPWADLLAGLPFRLVNLGKEGGAAASLAGDDLVPQAGPTDPAYVIYTSGSTGKPKGVLVEHRSLSNFALWAAGEYGLHPGDRVLQFSSISWDTSLEETAPALISGATLVLRQEGMLDSYAGFLKKVGDLGLTVLTFATAFWHELIEAMAADTLAMPEKVRLIVFGGGRASRERLRTWRRIVQPGVRLINTYGLTESSPVATWCDLTAVDEDRANEGVSIGGPIANMRAYVLDSRQRLVPIGIPGELYLAGEGLARGYAHQAELTAAIFLEGDVGDLGEKRLLKTGDLARVLPDGRLECLGRVDLQVKVRGHRIEPEEIEVYLARHPSVREAAVAARPAIPGSAPDDAPEDRLVAYVVASQGRPAPRAHDLRNFLRGWLPDFMLPSAYLILEDLPRTPSGKIDRTALPAPDWHRGEAVSSYVAPRDGLERQLAEVWERVLAVRPLGVMDDFFDLGGHSLLAVRLFAEIEKETGYRLPVRALFEAPTIEALSRRIRAGDWSPPYAHLVPLQTQGSRPPIFWVHAAGGHVVSFQKLARNLGPEQPSYALAEDETGEERPTPSTIEELAARYLREVERIQPSGPYLLGGLSFGGLVALEMARLIMGRGEAVALLALLDTRAPGIPRRLVSRDLVYQLRQRVEFHSGNLSTLSAQAKLRYVVQRSAAAAKRLALGGIYLALYRSGRSQPAWLRPIQAGYRLALLARKKYTPGAYPGRITLFRATRQPSGMDDPTLGWGGVAIGGVDILEIPGTHVSIMAEPALTALAGAVRTSLDKVHRTLDGYPPK